MTQFLNKSFSVYSGTGESYRDRWDAIFKKKERFFERHSQCSWMGSGRIYKHATDCKHQDEHLCACVKPHENRGCDSCAWPEQVYRESKKAEPQKEPDPCTCDNVSCEVHDPVTDDA